MSEDRQPCIICDELVEPGDGGQAIGPFPALHSKCLLRAHEASGGGMNDTELTEATQLLLEARRALGRAAAGRPPVVILAAAGLLLYDVIAFVKQQPDGPLGSEPGQPMRAILLEQARELGEHLIVAAWEDN